MRIKFQQVFWNYILFVLWGLIAFGITRFFPPMPGGLLITVLFIIFAPGFAIGRLLRLNLDDRLTRVIISMTIGFVYVWLLGFTAIFLGLNITVLTYVWLVLSGLLFAIAFVLEIKNPQPETPGLTAKDIFNRNNLIYLLVFAVGYLIIMYLMRTGALFKGGDANYHLATLRKVIGNEPLTVQNLNYTRDKMLIVYGLPVWHIFLGLVVKLAHSDIFIVWRDIAAALLAMAMPVWYWLSRKIFPSRDLAILAWLAFALIGFYWGPAFVYSSFGIPHTFSQLLLLPLAVGLGLVYAFEKPSWKLLIIIILLILTGTAVHITFYFLTILISFLIFYAAVCWSQPEYKKVVKRSAIIIGLQIAIIIPLFLFLELKGHVISSYLKILQDPGYPTNVKYHLLKDFNESSLYAYTVLPLVLVFVRRNAKLILPLAVLAITPLVYFTPAKDILAKLIGYVYIKRLYGNLDWHFLVWALVLGFILILVDRLIFKISHFGKFYRWTIEILLGFSTAFLFYWQERIDWAGTLWQSIFGGNIYNWVAENYFWLIIVMIILSGAIFIGQIFRSQIQDFFNLEDAKVPLARFFLVSIFVLILIAPEWALFKTYLFQKSGPEFLWRSMTPIATVKATTYSNSVGGAQIVDFINKNIPPKSVFDTNVGYFFLPVIVDQYMPIYSPDAPSIMADLFFDINETTTKRRLDILHTYDIDYLLVKGLKTDQSVFDSFPQYFTKIFPASAAGGDGKFAIYQVNKDQVTKDYAI